MPATFALGACRGVACLAWARGGSGFLARLGSSPVTEPPASLDLRGAADGTLTLLGGPVPMVWAQRLESIEGEPARWRSVLGQPGESPLLIDGPVHAAAWWGDAVALVGTQEVMLLRRRV
jgi:hypothetical protein